MQALALVAERLQPAGQLEQRRRANLGAVGEAEKDDAGLPPEGRFGDRRAFLVDQGEGGAERFAAIMASIPIEGQPADAGCHQDENADQDRTHHHKSPSAEIIAPARCRAGATVLEPCLEILLWRPSDGAFCASQFYCMQ